MIAKKYPAIFLVQITLSILLTGCNDEPEQHSNEPQREVLAFAQSVVQQQALAVNYATTGTIVSDQRIDVASRSSAYIEKILVREGDMVVKGQALIQLDSVDVDAAIQRVEASVNKASLALKDAQTDLQRFDELFKRGSVSESKLRKVRLQRDVAQDSLYEAKAVLQSTRSQRQYTQISSPIAGVVVARHKREGDLAAPAMPLLTLESSSGLLFETYVSEGNIHAIKQGDKVNVKIDALAASLVGTVVRIVPSGDPVTRKARVKISLPEHERMLPGMFGRTNFKLGSRLAVVIAPQSLVTRAGLEGVFVLDEASRIHFRWLRLGKENAGEIEVLVGLSVGERIVLQPDERLNDGDLIQQPGTVNE